jgi:hypothetical protein
MAKHRAVNVKMCTVICAELGFISFPPGFNQLTEGFFDFPTVSMVSDLPREE